MKSEILKKIVAIILIMMTMLTLGGCEKEKTILGEWKYDIAENADPDMENITVNITENVMYFKNRFDRSEAVNAMELTMDITYEKDETTIYATGMSINGEKQTSDEDFIQIPYTLLDENLMLDLNDVGLGKVIFSRVE